MTRNLFSRIKLIIICTNILAVFSGCISKALLTEIHSDSFQQREFNNADDFKEMPKSAVKAYYDRCITNDKQPYYVYYLQGVLRKDPQRILALYLRINNLGKTYAEEEEERSASRYRSYEKRDSSLYVGFRIKGKEIKYLPCGVHPVNIAVVPIIAEWDKIIDTIPLSYSNNTFYPSQLYWEPGEIEWNSEDKYYYHSSRIGYKASLDSSQYSLCIAYIDSVDSLKWISRDKPKINMKRSLFVLTGLADAVTYPFQLIGRFFEALIFAIGMSGGSH